jgi:hypothetical protein
VPRRSGSRLSKRSTLDHGPPECFGATTSGLIADAVPLHPPGDSAVDAVGQAGRARPAVEQQRRSAERSNGRRRTAVRLRRRVDPRLQQTPHPGPVTRSDSRRWPRQAAASPKRTASPLGAGRFLFSLPLPRCARAQWRPNTRPANDPVRCVAARLDRRQSGRALDAARPIKAIVPALRLGLLSPGESRKRRQREQCSVICLGSAGDPRCDLGGRLAAQRTGRGRPRGGLPSDHESGSSASA